MNTSVIISAGELAQLPPGEVVILDCRFSLMDKELGRKSYSEGHIPGAWFMDMEADLAGPVGEHGGRHPLPDRTDLQETLRERGVDADTLVVCYDAQRLAGSARLWWLLKYFGHEHVRVLNGGLPAWIAAGHQLTTKLPVAANGNVRLQPSPDMIASVEEVRGRNPGCVLVDSREAARYAGAEEPIDPIAGHIPGSVNYCWADITGENGMLHPEEFHTKHWSDIESGKNTIVYCGSGVTAAVNLLSMELAGLKGPKLYTGSWSDWISWPDNPVATEEDPTGTVLSRGRFP
jgi:thiosulfate/3-mercaptopyruvate sulfurtransferase